LGRLVVFLTHDIRLNLHFDQIQLLYPAAKSMTLAPEGCKQRSVQVPRPAIRTACPDPPQRRDVLTRYFCCGPEKDNGFSN